MKFYIPSKLQKLDHILKRKYPKEFYHLDKYYYFISKISENYVYSKQNTNYKFTNLNNKYLRKMLGSRYVHRIKKTLSELGILIINHSYKVNEFSKSYRINPNYVSPIISIDLNSKLERKKLYRKKLKIPTKFKKLYEFLNHLEIDYDKAIQHLKNIQPNINLQQYNNYLISIEKIHNKDYFFKNDRNTGRLFTNLTNLKKDFRQFLKLKKENLIEIDVKNSQPLLLNVLCDKLSPHKIIDRNEYNKYKLLSQSGKLYDYFIPLFKKEYDLTLTRQEIKTSFFGKIFFCKLTMNDRYKESKIFKKYFPQIFDIILEYKKYDYCNLAIQLQKMEASIIIEQIALVLSQQNIPILTIHDSILTTPKHINLVYKKIKEVFAIYNLKPCLRINKYN